MEEMILNVVLTTVIIAIWVFIGALSYSFYSAGKVNRFLFKNLYVSAVLNVFQAVLGLYYIVTGDGSMQEIRWMTFSLLELNFLHFVLKAYNNRHVELIVMAVFNIMILMSAVNYSLPLNCAIALILSVLAYTSGVEILKKHFSWVFLIYGVTSVIPTIFEFTTAESLATGVIFSLAFMVGVIKLYKKEKVSVELIKLFKENKL